MVQGLLLGLGLSHIERILLRILVQSALGKNIPRVLDLQNLALEQSCVAPAIQVVGMLAGIRAGVPKGHCESPGC